MVYEEREDETEDGMGEREIKKVSRMLGPTIWGWGYVSREREDRWSDGRCASTVSLETTGLN